MQHNITLHTAWIGKVRQAGKLFAIHGRKALINDMLMNDGKGKTVTESLFESIKAQDDLIDEHESCEEGLSSVLRCAIDMLFEHSIRNTVILDCQTKLFEYAERSHEKMKSVHHSRVERRWRRLYTDCKLIDALLTLKRCNDAQPREVMSDKDILESIRGLDMALIVAGSPGKGRLDLVQMAISCLQNHLVITRSPSTASSNTTSTIAMSNTFCAADRHIETLSDLPDLEEFLGICHSSCYVIKGAILDWPCFEPKGNDDEAKRSSWADADYLNCMAGPGRFVPVEIGKNYLDKGWKQDIILFDDFLNKIGWGKRMKSDQQITYLAQYNLLDQFPTLRSGIFLPDLVYSLPSAPAYFPQYVPPKDAEDGTETVLLNAWLGSDSTVSPAHRDPYYNFYAQVVGSKLVWIAPPEPGIAEAMKCEEETTSSVDVFTDSPKSLDFETYVRPKARFAILQPGDVLIMPPGWLHAFKALSKSFSVSMWF